MKLSERWRHTKMPKETRDDVLKLVEDVRRCVSENRMEEALVSAKCLHTLSQNDAKLHVYGHLINAKVYLKADQKRQALRHLYLSLMAPYGTVRRRLQI